MRQIALVTAHAAADKPLARFEVTSETQACSVHGLAHALDADLWEGWRLSNEFLRMLPGYRAVVVNGNTPLLPVASEIARLRKPGQVVCLLQEGDARVWDTMSAEGLASWCAAASAADRCLLYNDGWAPAWEALSRNGLARQAGTPARRVILPHPSDAERHRVSATEREKAVFIASGVVSRRGGLLGAGLVRRALAEISASDWKVYVPQGHYGNGRLPDRDFAAEIEKRLDLTVVPWRSYHKYLAFLARCRLAVNLDISDTYGRFAADCAALHVPCVGYANQPAQEAYWSELTVSCLTHAELFSCCRLVVDPGHTDHAPEYYSRSAEAAAADFTPEQVREAFRKAVAE